MNTTHPFDFAVDKSTRTVVIKREFAANLSLVWDAFTTREILDQWWAPKPWSSRTKTMNFEVGGRRVYAMVSPEGHERWAIWNFTAIHPKTNFKMWNAFADQNENLELPGSEWDFTFADKVTSTEVTITITNESQERFERMLEMGFQQGFTMTLNSLVELLPQLSKG